MPKMTLGDEALEIPDSAVAAMEALGWKVEGDHKPAAKKSAPARKRAEPSKKQ